MDWWPRTARARERIQSLGDEPCVLWMTEPGKWTYPCPLEPRRSWVGLTCKTLSSLHCWTLVLLWIDCDCGLIFLWVKEFTLVVLERLGLKKKKKQLFGYLKETEVLKNWLFLGLVLLKIRMSYDISINMWPWGWIRKESLWFNGWSACMSSWQGVNCAGWFSSTWPKPRCILEEGTLRRWKNENIPP